MAGNDNYNNDLLPLLAQGDVTAFDTIYNLYAKRLYRFAYNRIGNVEESEEIIQEIFLTLWEKRNSLSHVQALYPYLYSSVKNAVVQYRLRNARHLKYEETFRQFASSFDTSGEDQLALAETQQAIERSLEALPERARMAFRLSRMENLSIQHIAERMNISPRTAENYITTALKHLRNSLGKVVVLAAWFGL